MNNLGPLKQDHTHSSIKTVLTGPFLALHVRPVPKSKTLGIDVAVLFTGQPTSGVISVKDV